MLIRTLDPLTDLDAVLDLYTRATDFWLLTDHRTPDLEMAQAFFTDSPPKCDPALTQHFGLFAADRLIGVAQLFFGWPNPGDPFLGLQLLAPEARGQGLGPVLLAEVEARSRAAGAQTLYLAVLEENPRAWAFWQSHGFCPTGVTRRDDETGNTAHRMSKPL